MPRDRYGRFTAERTTTTTTVTERVTYQPAELDLSPPVIITPATRDAWRQLTSEHAGILDHHDQAQVDAWAAEARHNTNRLAQAGVSMAGYWDESWYTTLPHGRTL